MREFPGSPVVRTQDFHCRGPQFYSSIPGGGTKIPQAMRCSQKSNVCISLTILRFPFSLVFSSYIYYHVPPYIFLLIYHAWSSQVFLNFWLDILHGFRKFQQVSFLSSFLLLF